MLKWPDWLWTLRKTIPFLCGKVWIAKSCSLEELQERYQSLQPAIHLQLSIWFWIQSFCNPLVKMERQKPTNFRNCLRWLGVVNEVMNLVKERFQVHVHFSQGSKYRILGSYRMGFFHIGYRGRYWDTRPYRTFISDTIYNEILITKS